MKRTVSIFLVALLLLNVMGYYGLFMGLKYKHAVQAIERINADDFDESEALTIRIPLSIPYAPDTDFERVDGAFEHEGQYYRMVKQKLEKDTLHIVCILDTKAGHIQTALQEYVKTFADQSADRSGAKTIPTFIKDYCPSSFTFLGVAGGWVEVLKYSSGDAALLNPIISISSPPPKG